MIEATLIREEDMFDIGYKCPRCFVKAPFDRRDAFADSKGEIYGFKASCTHCFEPFISIEKDSLPFKFSNEIKNLQPIIIDADIDKLADELFEEEN